jgi:2-polyprenyl-6-methoxyphenol hydroxylase-like FAD-dependent oxidoreductase
MRAGVVGGSIAGTAVLLGRSSRNATVFERNPSLYERGSGIGLAFAGVEEIIVLDLADPEIAGLRLSRSTGRGRPS